MEDLLQRAWEPVLRNDEMLGGGKRKDSQIYIESGFVMIGNHDNSKRHRREQLAEARASRRRVRNDEMSTEVNMEVEAPCKCDNCQRSLVEVTKVSAVMIVFQKKWCLMRKNQTGFMLCTECRQHATARTKKAPNKNIKIIWPAFTAKILVICANDMATLWPFTPAEWRAWWLAHVQTNSPGANITMDDPEALMRDGTKQRNMMKTMHQDLSVVSWMEFRDNFRDYNSFPVVRCPWGCSEYFTPGNYTPLDTFMQYYLVEPISTYSSEARIRCAIGFRRDLMDRLVPILGNKQFLCMPTVAFIRDEGPQILTCRCHSHLNKSMWVLVMPR